MAGEYSPELPYEDQPPEGGQYSAPPPPEVIKEKILAYDKASRGLSDLGKDETGARYAYRSLSVTDMKLTDVSVILGFKHVFFVDVSGNYLTTKSLEVLTKMPFLILLKAERNRVESPRLSPAHYLQVLNLSRNQIKDTSGIDQPLLDCLELNHNDIYATNFETANLEALKQLELRGNNLFEIGGFLPPNLEKLYMAANKITIINSPEFGKLRQLQVLHLRDNGIQKLDGFSEEMDNLKYVNLRNNKISKFGEFRKLQCLPKLETLVVKGNPLAGSDEGEAGEGGEGGEFVDRVVLRLLALLPGLKRVNKRTIGMGDRVMVERVQKELLEEILREEEDTHPDTERESSGSSESKSESEVE